MTRIELKDESKIKLIDYEDDSIVLRFHGVQPRMKVKFTVKGQLDQIFPVNNKFNNTLNQDETEFEVDEVTELITLLENDVKKEIAKVKELKDVIDQLEGCNDDMVRRGNKRHAELQKYKQFAESVKEWVKKTDEEKDRELNKPETPITEFWQGRCSGYLWASDELKQLIEGLK
jgi:hypothetical protein